MDIEATSPYSLLSKLTYHPISLKQSGPNPNAVKSPTANVKQPGAFAGADLAGAATGALGLASSVIGVSQRRFNFGDIAPSQTDYNSAPTYTSGQMVNEVSGAKPKGASAGDILSGAGQGASIGTSILPGIGTAVGAGIGALATGIGGLIGKNQQDTEKNRKMGEIRVAQNKYNQEDESYRQRQNQLYNYYNQNNAEGREYNVYKSRFNT